MRRRTRRRRGVVAPDWSPSPIPVALSQLQPIQGWVIVQEEFQQDLTVEIGKVTLVVPKLNIPNTTFAWVKAIHKHDSSMLNVSVGDMIIYREWSGARWDFAGETVLIMEIDNLLAKVQE